MGSNMSRPPRPTGVGVAPTTAARAWRFRPTFRPRSMPSRRPGRCWQSFPRRIATPSLAETESRLGPVDILVNSAAIGGVNTTVGEYPVEEWRAVIDVNLTGTFLTCRAVVPGMQRRGYGRIVNIASIAGKEGNPNACAYSASKAGVIALTKSLGKELATAGICVNAVAPAVIETEMLEQSTREHIAYMVSKIPMGRLGQVDEVAALVCWLASAECSFSTGAVFDISGGRATD